MLNFSESDFGSNYKSIYTLSGILCDLIWTALKIGFLGDRVEDRYGKVKFFSGPYPSLWTTNREAVEG